MASIKDLKRMCEKHSKCVGCPFIEFDCCEPDHFSDNADEIVDKWVAEHPVKTYAMDFFEKFPDAKKRADGVTPIVCRRFVYDDNESCKFIGSCIKCWNREMKEQ